MDVKRDSTSSQRASDTRPGLAIIANVVAPYRVSLHQLLARGIPQLKLHSIFTHTAAEFDWAVDLPPEIHAVSFAKPGESATQSWRKRPRRDLQKARQIIAYLHENNVRAVILNGYSNLTFLRIIRHCRRHRIPLFLRGDSNICGDRPGSPLKAWLKKRVVRWIVRQCAGVMSVGTLGEQFFLKYGADPARMFRVTFAPDYESFARVDFAELAAFRRKHQLSPERKYMVFAGRLAPVKRVDLLIDAFAKIANERQEWGLIIAGDGPLMTELKDRVPTELADRVHWLGFCQVREMTLAYHASQVMVLPSDYEPWALVVNEAMAAGLVVVASDVVGAAYDMVKDRVSGRIFASGNVDDLTAALRDVTDPVALLRYRQAVAPTLALWREEFDPVVGVRRALAAAGVKLG